jgi:hypothetical protein
LARSVETLYLDDSYVLSRTLSNIFSPSLFAFDMGALSTDEKIHFLVDMNMIGPK